MLAIQRARSSIQRDKRCTAYLRLCNGRQRPVSSNSAGTAAFNLTLPQMPTTARSMRTAFQAPWKEKRLIKGIAAALAKPAAISAASRETEGPLQSLSLTSFANCSMLDMLHLVHIVGGKKGQHAHLRECCSFGKVGGKVCCIMRI